MHGHLHVIFWIDVMLFSLSLLLLESIRFAPRRQKAIKLNEIDATRARSRTNTHAFINQCIYIYLYFPFQWTTLYWFAHSLPTHYLLASTSSFYHILRWFAFLCLVLDLFVDSLVQNQQASLWSVQPNDYPIYY